VTVDLPWSQLEQFSGYSSGRDTIYQDLLAAEPSGLRSIKYAANCFTRASFSPTRLVVLPKLESLSIEISGNGSDLPSHLETLIVPSLAVLAVLGSLDSCPQNPLTGAISRMIRNSGCSLRELNLQNIDIRINAFAEILSLSPNIVKLDIPHTNTEGLQRLFLDPNSPYPVLPKLKTLVLWTTRHYGTLGSDAARPAVIDAYTLMKMVRSRTVNLFADLEQDIGLFSPLEELTVHGYDIRNLYAQLLLLETPVGVAELPDDGAISATAVGLDGIASRFSTFLEGFLSHWPTGSWGGGKPYRDVKHHLELNKQMQEMENLNLEKYLGFTPILIVRANALDRTIVDPDFWLVEERSTFARTT
jgi:hypothetical protein